MTAREVPAATVNRSAAADFDAAPRIRDDLFAADCSTNTDDRRVCHLYLRGYEHEKRDSFVARTNGSYYRVACTPHGD